MLALWLALSAAHEPPPWPGQVRVQSAEASGGRPFWDPALTEAPAADDRELAWDALATIATRPTSWYQRVPLLSLLRARRSVEAARLETDAETLEAFFRDHGFPGAEVTARTVDTPGPTLDVIFEVEPGAGAYTGLRHARAVRTPGWRVIPTASALGRGTTLSAYGGVHGAWTRADHRDAVDLHAEVGGRAFLPDGRLSSNVGVWSDLYAVWSRALSGRVALRHRLGVQTDMWPWVHHLSAGASTAVVWTPTAKFTLETGLGAGRWVSWAWSGQRQGYEPWFGGTPLAPGQRQFAPSYTWARVDVRAVVDGTDRAVLPRRGARIDAAATPFGWAAGAPFFKLDLDVRAFIPLVGQRWVAALRGRVMGLDWLDPDGRSLLGERGFLGAVDLRAWGRRTIVPPDYPGNNGDLRTGGETLAFGSASLRWHVHRDLAVALFADTGRVWEGLRAVKASDLLVDAGVSVMVPSPLGVVRLDVAARIVDQEVDDGLPATLQLWLDQAW